MKVIFFALIALALAEEMLVTQEMTDYLKKHVSWEVADYEENIFKGWTVEEFRRILGDSEEEYYEDVPEEQDIEEVPESASCTHEIRDQKSCGSCWAFATASVVSDRCCQDSQDYGWLSPQELVSCDKRNSGCNGGLAATALEYVMANGLVQEACFPYVASGVPCPSKCKNGGDWKTAHKCKFTKKIDCSQEAGMKKCFDAKMNAITIRMIVYQDFTSYKSGIYCHKTGGALGGHAIRGVGYGTSPVLHIICANSWGTGWGDKGYFKIEAKESCGIRMTKGDAWSAQGF